MSELDAMSAILSHFETQWAARTPIAYENAPVPDVADVAWVRITVNETDDPMQASLNKRPLHRHFGAVVVQVFTPLKSGPKAGLDLAAQAAAIFRDATGQPIVLEKDASGMIVFRSPGVASIGPDAGWYQHNMRAGFRRNVIH